MTIELLLELECLGDTAHAKEQRDDGDIVDGEERHGAARLSQTQPLAGLRPVALSVKEGWGWRR